MHTATPKLKGIWHRGEFAGFSAWVGEWTAPQPYKRLMLALRDVGSDVVSRPYQHAQRRTFGGYGEL